MRAAGCSLSEDEWPFVVPSSLGVPKRSEVGAQVRRGRAKTSYVYGMLTSMRPFIARAVPGRVTSRDQPWIRCALLMYDNCSIPGLNMLYRG